MFGHIALRCGKSASVGVDLPTSGPLSEFVINLENPAVRVSVCVCVCEAVLSATEKYSFVCACVSVQLHKCLQCATMHTDEC